MNFGINRTIMMIAAIALVFMFSPSVCAGLSLPEQELLPTGAITIDPPFATVGERSDLLVTLEVTNTDLEFVKDRLMLQKQRYRGNGSTVFVPIALLRDDGENGDAVAGDHIFTGVASFEERVTGTIRLRAVGLTTFLDRILLVSRTFSVPARLACGPTGSILPVNIFEAGQANDGFEPVEFEVPEGGEAVLRLVNGARIGAPMRERVAMAKISVNGQQIRPFARRANVVEVPVELLQGANVLTLDKLVAKPGQRLSARIEACADRIVLDPVENAAVVSESIGASARVTALGLPVEDADVRFEVIEAGVQETVPTSPSGSASALLKVEAAGTDTLRATVVRSRPTLVAETPIEVLPGRGLVLAQRPDSLRLEAGSEGLVEFTIDVRFVEGAQDLITLQSIVAPGGNGLSVEHGFPAQGLDVTEPRSVTAIARATADQPGAYTVATTATNADTGESFSVVLPVEVVEPDTPDPLLLGIPMARPSGAEPDTPTPVTFRAQVDGTSTPPEVLFLDELDVAGQVLELAAAELRDDGSGADTVAGDLIYSGPLEIDRPGSELRFRVRAAYFGEEVVSGATSFLVTPFPQQARPSDPVFLAPVGDTESRVFSNEVEIKVIPGVLPQNVEQIAASIGGTVVGVIAPLRIYLIEFPGDGSADGVSEAIATLSTFSQVESAAPNFEVTDASITFSDGSSCEPTEADCPDDGDHANQWYLSQIGARQAWELAGGGSSSAKVAVIDNGVNCAHTDLIGRCTGTGSDPHATQVAGLIGANANNGTGIAGIAWNTELESVAQGVGDGLALKNSMTTMSDDEKIVNISQRVLLLNSWPDHVVQIGYLRDAVCHAVDAGKLVVVAGGNLINEDDENYLYPARLSSETGHLCPGGQLMVNQLLAVGGSNQSDGRATWSESGFSFKSSDANYLDIYAPGVGILTITSPSGETTVNGSSFATPLVSGAAAVLWAHGNFAAPSGKNRAQAVRDRLIDTGDSVTSICPTCKRLNLAEAVTTPVNVPDVVGLPQADAEAAIVGAGLTLGVETTAHSDTVPSGGVISQNPAGGSSVLPGSAVDLVISIGPALRKVINVSSLDGSNGFVIDGAETGDGAGYSVDTAGDVNNDGYADILIGAPFADGPVIASGEAYVVFGGPSFPSGLDLSNLNGANGFAMPGVKFDGDVGSAVSSAGDINNDGFDDVLVGAATVFGDNDRTGDAYVVFGKDTPFGLTFDLNALDGTNGFAVNGDEFFGHMGQSVSGGGDVNDDGVSDIIIGEPLFPGRAYVVLGKFSGNFDATVDESALSGSEGTKIFGLPGDNRIGWDVATRGDFNGDNIDDIILGTPFTEPGGKVYVLFGTGGGLPATIDLNTLNGTNGFVVSGLGVDDDLGHAVAFAGDMNNDGRDEIALEAPGADANGIPNAGKIYVIFGSAGSNASFDLNTLNGSNGFVVNGIAQGGGVGGAVAGAGDVNSDGFDDLVIGATFAEPNDIINEGEVYIIFGKGTAFGPAVSLQFLDPASGFIVQTSGSDHIGWSVAGAGDVNNDGFDDIAIGALFGGDAGRVYVLYGWANN